MCLSVTCSAKCENNLKHITSVAFFNSSFFLKYSLQFITNCFRCFAHNKLLTNYTHKNQYNIPFTP